MSVSLERWSGDGHCGFYLQRYVIELEAYCVECDRAVCPLCATRGRGRAGCLCPECIEGAGRGEEAKE